MLCVWCLWLVSFLVVLCMITLLISYCIFHIKSVGIYQEMSSHATRQGTLSYSHLSSLSHWTDPSLKGGISLRKLILTLKKKKLQAGNELLNILPKSSHAWKKWPQYFFSTIYSSSHCGFKHDFIQKRYSRYKMSAIINKHKLIWQWSQRIIYLTKMSSTMAD